MTDEDSNNNQSCMIPILVALIGAIGAIVAAWISGSEPSASNPSVNSSDSSTTQTPPATTEEGSPISHSGSRGPISEGIFKFDYSPYIYYSNGGGEYCVYSTWESYMELTDGKPWRIQEGRLGEYTMTYHGACGYTSSDINHPHPEGFN